MKRRTKKNETVAGFCVYLFLPGKKKIGLLLYLFLLWNTIITRFKYSQTYAK